MQWQNCDSFEPFPNSNEVQCFDVACLHWLQACWRLPQSAYYYKEHILEYIVKFTVESKSDSYSLIWIKFIIIISCFSSRRKIFIFHLIVVYSIIFTIIILRHNKKWTICKSNVLHEIFENGCHFCIRVEILNKIFQYPSSFSALPRGKIYC